MGGVDTGRSGNIRSQVLVMGNDSDGDFLIWTWTQRTLQLGGIIQLFLGEWEGVL